MRETQRGYGRRLVSPNRTTLGIVAAALALVAAMVFPRVLPAARNGPACSDLPAPLGGNNRSVLAYRSDSRRSLDLELALAQEVVRLDEPLSVELTFINGDQGPIILHLPRQSPILSTSETVQGITFEITRVGGAAALADQQRTYQPPVTFTDRDELHLLGSRARCTEHIALTPTDLAGIGVTPGEYRIRAYYRNNSPGDPRPIQPIDATATPFPEYTTSQGVWVGDARSNEVRFTVIAPGQAVQ